MQDTKSQEAVRRLRGLVDALPVGDRLPSERDLATEWGVARMTARKAIETLLAEGRLDRRRGSGTYVAQMPYAKTLGLSSFSADMRRRGMIPSTEVLELSHTAADVATAHRLDVDKGDPIVRFTRLRSADSAPVGVETTWMSAELVPGLTSENLAESLFDTLAGTYGITVAQASSTIDPVAADPETAAHLGIEPDHPCLRIRMQYLDHRKRVVMAATCLYRGDLYQLQVVLTSSAFASSPASTPPS